MTNLEWLKKNLSEERINDILHEMDNPKKKETIYTSLTR